MNLTIYIVFFILLSFFPLLHYVVSRKSIEESFLYHIKKKRIDWKKVLKFYICANIFSFLVSINNEMMDIIDIFMMPILFITFLLVLYFFSLHPENSERLLKDINPDDIKVYKKQKERDDKINKILK